MQQFPFTQKQTVVLLHSQTRVEHTHGKSILLNNINTKLTLTWTGEKASQTALNKFLCKINFDEKCRNIKAVMQWFVYTNLHVSCLNKRVKQLVVYGEQEFSFSTFAAHFKFPNLFPLFLLILKHFQNVFKCFLAVYCLIWNVYYNITASLISVGRSNHDIFYFFSEKLLCSQSAGCYFETFYSIIIITLIK